MINKSILIIFLLVSSLYSQNKIYLSVNPGENLYSSENSMKMLEDKKIQWLPGLSIGYERGNIWGYILYFEYNYSYRKIDGVLSWARTGPDSPEIIATFGSDYVLSINNFDIGIKYNLTDNLSCAIGPTIAFVSRSFVIDEFPYIPGETVSNNIDDRLVSVCAGINASLNLQIPFSSGSNYMFLYSSLKFRYLHSLWFDARGRNVDNYYQSFLVSQLNLGLGYNF
jgi:hypothetical protein